MLNIIGHLYLMDFDFPLLRSLHFEYDLLFCVFNDGIFMPHRAFHLGLVWLVRCVIVLTAFLVKIRVMLKQELIAACTVQ